MALRIAKPHFDGPPSLVFKSDISWYIKEPAMVVWKDAQSDTRTLCLGQPCPCTEHPNITLWVGQRSDDNSIIALLQMTVFVRLSSRRKAFELFTILPDHSVNHAQGDHEPEHPAIPIKSVPKEILECLHHTGDHASDRRRLMHLFLNTKGQTQVVMKTRPEGAKPITGTALHLMLLLESLSRMSTFDIYIPYSNHASVLLPCLYEDRLVRTSAGQIIDFVKAYAGNGGCLDEWEQYNAEHFHKSPNLNTTTSVSNSRKRQRESSPAASQRRKGPTTASDKDVLQFPPPPYEQPVVATTIEKIRLDNQGTINESAFEDDRSCECPPLASQHDEETGQTPSNMCLETALQSPPHISLRSSLGACSDAVPETPHASYKPFHDTAPDENSYPASVSPFLNDPVRLSLWRSLVSWILVMQSIDRHFYKVSRLQDLLFALGNAVCADDAGAFISAKARATTVVMARSAAATISTATHDPQSTHRKMSQTAIEARIRRLLPEVEAFVKTLLEIDRDAELFMIDDLQKLTNLAVLRSRYVKRLSRLNLGVGQEPEILEVGEDVQVTHLTHQFDICEAECLANFFCHSRFGSQGH